MQSKEHIDEGALFRRERRISLGFLYAGTALAKRASKHGNFGAKRDLGSEMLLAAVRVNWRNRLTEVFPILVAKKSLSNLFAKEERLQKRHLYLLRLCGFLQLENS